jgi:aminopeptidase
MLGQTDARDHELARILVNYSTKAKRGELAFIHCVGRDTLRLGAACAEEAIRAGAAPYIQFTDPEVNRRIVRAAGEGVFRRLGRFELKQMKDADIYIGIRGADNSFEMSDVPRPQLNLYNRHIVKPVHLEERVKRTRWVVLRYPNSAMAQMAQTSTEAFGEFFYRVCCVDYARMLKAAQPLKALMRATDQLHITGPGTDLRFSIKGVGVVPCCGECNIPDGECFTAPVRNSVEGTVQFNTPTLWEGAAYENVFLRFEKGKAVEARAANADQTRRLNRVLDQDPGARYLGEFSIAFNPHVLEPMRDILFDEKIAGSFHMALGQCYGDASNGNKSAVHWDLVCIQRPEYGGGEIRFDGRLVRKDGEFVVPALKGLNRDRYKG